MPVDYPHSNKPPAVVLARGQLPMIVVSLSFLLVLGLLMAVVPLFIP